MLLEDVELHGACPDEAEAAGIADGGREAPTAAPDHAPLHDGVLGSEDLAEAIVLHL